MIQKQWEFCSSYEKLSLSSLLVSWKENFPSSGVLVFVAESTKESVSDLQELCKEIDIPLIGAIFPEIIHDSIFETEGLLLVRLDKMPEYFLTNNIGSDEQVDLLSNQIAEKVRNSNNKSLFLVFDSMVPNVATILDRMYFSLADSVQYSGVSAGSETFEPMPCLFDSEEIIQDGVLAILSPDSVKALLSHGYPMPSEMIIATSSKGNCIQSIDWQPAFEVHQKLAKEWYDTEITVDNFYEVAVHFPFGIVLASGEILVRIPVGLSDEGALFCVGEVPENSMLTILHGRENVLFESVQKFSKACQETKQQGLTFYCAGRRMHLGKKSAIKELAVLGDQGNEVIGALSLGEIGMSEASAYPQFHNAALVYTPWLNHES